MSDSAQSSDLQVRINDFWLNYRVPIVLGSISVTCIMLSLIMLFKTARSEEPIIFSNTVNTIGQLDNVMVDIAGGVNNPGVYKMSSGSRLKDVIDRAGGFSDNANQEYIAKYINQAEMIEDGVKIFVPINDKSITSHNIDSATSISSQNLVPLLRSSENESSQNRTVSQKSITSNVDVAGVTSLININTASQKELESLPGIGPVTAGKIIAGRPYGSLKELNERQVVGDKVFEKIKLLIGY